MPSGTYTLELPPQMLIRGFWLYVWQVQTPLGSYLYVGRTGDNSSPNATSPYHRMGQHLGFQKDRNALRKHLTRLGVDPLKCQRYQLVAHGPLYPEKKDMKTHIGPRDIVAAFEKALAADLSRVGYNVMNTVRCNKPVDAKLFRKIKTAFTAHFPLLKKI